MKMFDFNSLVFVWLLPLAASVSLTSGLHNMPTHDSINHSQMTTPMSVAMTPTANTNPLEKKSPPTLPTGQSVTTPESTGAWTPETTPSNKPDSPLKSETAYTATLPSSQPSAAPPNHSSSTSTQQSVMSSTSEFSTSITTSSPTPTLEVLTSHLTTSVKTEVVSFTSIQATTGTETLTFRSTSQTTKRIKKQQEKKESNSGKIVAGLIGGALALMMVGFLAIYIKKRKIQKQQTMATDWAGPSPFLQDEGDGCQFTQRPANRISIASFLPHRLSKRLSLLHDTDQELKDMSPAITFGHEGQIKDTKESNGLSASETKTQSDNGEPSESPSSAVSSNTGGAPPEDPANPANA